MRLEKQMVCAILGGKLKEISAVIWGDLIFLLFLVWSADLDIPCSGLFFNRVKFYIFNQVYAQDFHPDGLRNW